MQWQLKWAHNIWIFDFPEVINRVTYTTNTIAPLNSRIRKHTNDRPKVKSECSNELAHDHLLNSGER